jgi:hypothetical protein
MRKAVFLGLVLWLARGSGLFAGEEGLIGHWRFDTPGPEVADLSGHGHAARLAGGKIVRGGGPAVLALDGGQQIVVPSSPELNLARDFSIEARLRFDRMGDGHTLIFKDNQYSIRMDWTSEGRKISFFVCADRQWEPRVSTLVPEPGRWYHLVATWNGREAALWVNGEPFQTVRGGNPPPPNGNPLVIASQAAHGLGICGAIDYVKIYRRTLSAAEIIRRAYGIQPDPKLPGRSAATFEFDKIADAQGWTAGPGAEVRCCGGQLVLTAPAGRALALHRNLQADVGKRDYLGLRMAVDAGSRGEVVFVTTQGAGRIPFPTHADGKPHAYVLEPWTWPGWGGKLLALAVLPSEASGTTARIDYLRITEEPRAEPEICVTDVFADSVIPRAGRLETIVGRVKNLAGPAAALEAELTPPEGVVAQGPTVQPIAPLGYLEQRDVAWRVRAEHSGAGDFRVVVRGAGVRTGVSQRLSFAASLGLARAAYVPSPLSPIRASTPCGPTTARSGRKEPTSAGRRSNRGRSESRSWVGTTRASRRWPTGTLR